MKRLDCDGVCSSIAVKRQQNRGVLDRLSRVGRLLVCLAMTLKRRGWCVTRGGAAAVGVVGAS